MAETFLLKLIFLVLASSSDPEEKSTKLARDIKNGSHKAFKSFFKAHHENLFRFLVSKGIDRETAEDLIQKAFVYIWEHRDNIDENKSLRSYLFTIGYTRMLNHIRDHKKFDKADFEEATASHSSDSGSPEDYAREKELKEAIDRAVDAMPEKRRMVFDLCFLQEFTYRETADAMDISIKTVENHMGLALKDIRAALSDYS